MSLPTDYAERVYAGVLGKIIGVYLGRPFEGWGYDQIMQELGEVWYYMHEKRGMPLIVTDDDISGTFTFLRALPDHDYSPDLAPAQIGQTWLNYIIEERTILWWGGMGTSTEHTAYLRLKQGIPAPRSGSIELNGRVVAEQIGAQIFIDGWGMVCPGDPERAADFARRAASVSHDGEAVYGAQVVAAMEAQAFVEDDINTLIDTAVALIPADSIIARMIADIRAWHAADGDWRTTRERIVERYGYDTYGGGCHMVPNHALIILALLYGEGDFQKSLMIVNTSGWDTDCNSGNVGCLLGIRGGLAGIEEGPDWRGPVSDRLYLPTADGGRCITDALTEAMHIVNAGRALAGLQPLAPKNGARFHFEMPGSVQSFRYDRDRESRGTLIVRNVEGQSVLGRRSLALHCCRVAAGRPARAGAATFLTPHAAAMVGYGVIASPTLYPGQTVRAPVSADESNVETVTCRLYLKVYDANDELALVYGPETDLAPDARHDFEWRIPDTGGYPVAEIGVEIASEVRMDGIFYLDYLTWEGAPELVLKPVAGTMWRRAWVEGVDAVHVWGDSLALVQNEGVGLLIQGTREWQDYSVSADIRPHLATCAGIAARVQGMRRYYALLLCRGNRARLVKALDGEQILAEVDFPWEFGEKHRLELEVRGDELRASIDGRVVAEAQDLYRPLTGGAVALVVEEGRAFTQTVRVQQVE